MPNLYGQDMWPTISDGAPSPRDTVVINWDEETGAIIKGKYKLNVGNLATENVILKRGRLHLYFE